MTYSCDGLIRVHQGQVGVHGGSSRGGVRRRRRFTLATLRKQGDEDCGNVNADDAEEGNFDS